MVGGSTAVTLGICLALTIVLQVTQLTRKLWTKSLHSGIGGSQQRLWATSTPAINLNWSIIPTPVDEIVYPNAYYKCPVGKRQARHKVSLVGKRDWTFGSPSLKPLVDFKVSIRTNSSILILGDSIGGQVSDWLADALGEVKRKEIESNSTNGAIALSTTITESQVAYVRSAGLLTRKFHQNNIWSLVDASNLLEAAHVDSFDTCLYRIPVPHINFTEVTYGSLEESMQTLRRFYGCGKGVLLMTVPLNNNINTEEWMEQYHETNELIRKFATTSPQNDIRLLDLDRLTRAVIQANARDMGLEEDETLSLRLNNESVWKPLQSMLCRYRSDKSICEPNMITVDGVHLCPETMAGRFNAGVACLLECYSSSRDCQEDCNDKYMTLRPITDKLTELATRTERN